MQPGLRLFNGDVDDDDHFIPTTRRGWLNWLRARVPSYDRIRVAAFLRSRDSNDSPDVNWARAEAECWRKWIALMRHFRTQCRPSEPGCCPNTEFILALNEYWLSPEQINDRVQDYYRNRLHSDKSGCASVKRAVRIEMELEFYMTYLAATHIHPAFDGIWNSFDQFVSRRRELGNEYQWIRKILGHSPATIATERDLPALRLYAYLHSIDPYEHGVSHSPIDDWGWAEMERRQQLARKLFDYVNESCWGLGMLDRSYGFLCGPMELVGKYLRPAHDHDFRIVS